ncbi:MAG TPA: methyltransferase domain-containing protein [Kofleriaceae bacterium]|nr:methyltransferase domain-containing protein [Kofleriaceae bacterium]
MVATRRSWQPFTTERAVERLYGHHDPAAADSHAGYLNFGLWEPGVTDYVAAAEAMVVRLGELLALAPGSRMLDAACGRGTQDFALDRRFGPLEIDAVDVTWKHVEAARTRADRERTPRLRFHHASAVELPFEDGRFSHALCLEAAHHFDTRARFVAEAYRVLAPGGRLALADFALVRAPERMWERALFGGVAAMWSVPRANTESLASYGAMLRAIGFTEIELQVVGARTFPGFWASQRRIERRREVQRIRGRLGAAVGTAMSYGLCELYRRGWIEYVLVAARKPG